MLYPPTQERSTTRLRKMMQQPGLIMAPGAFSPLSARLVEQAGFGVVYMTGGGSVGNLLGLPDVGLVTMTEIVTQARNVASVVSIPVISDADTGYGNPINMIRTVREFESAGVAAIHIEDQLWPKKCGHLEGKRLVPAEEMVQKVRAAVDARRDPDFVIIARSDALAVEGMDAALRRGDAYAKAGADVLFIEAPRSVEDLQTIGSRFRGVPLLFNMASSGKTPFLTKEEVEELGFKIMIFPIFSLLAAVKAMQGVLRDLKETGDVRQILDRTATWKEFFEIVGIEEVKALEEKYAVNAP